jgi:hypothetical protein
MKRPRSPGKLLAQTVAAVAIAVFWCVSAVGTIGTTLGVTTLATAINAATSAPAEAGRRYRRGRYWRGGRRRRRGRRWRGGIWVPYWYWW